MARKDTQFKKGNKQGKGRPKGSKNKISKRVLDAAYKSLGEDAFEYMDMLKDTDLSTYWRLMFGLIPKDIDLHADIDARITTPITVNFIESDKGKDEPVALQSVG